VSEPALEDVYRLISQAEAREHGDERVALAVEAVRIADVHQNEGMGWRARRALVRAGIHGGYPEQGLVAFAWCLERCDRDPRHFSERELLWAYKWMARAVLRFPSISRQRVDDLLSDMHTRYERNGISLQPVYKHRWVVALDMGRLDELRGWHEKWCLTAKDHHADCPACEIIDQVAHKACLGDDEAAVALAQPVITRERTCGSSDEELFPALLGSLERLGARAESDRLGARVRESVLKNQTFVGEAGALVWQRVHRGDLEGASAVAEGAARFSRNTRNLCARFGYLLGVRALRVAEGAEAGDIDTELDSIASSFDERNATPAYSRRLALAREDPQAVPFGPFRLAELS
jgi:hypothetical protein